MDPIESLDIRPLEAADHPFILDSWTKYLRLKNKYWSDLQHKALHAAGRLIKSVLERPMCRVYVGTFTPPGEAEIIAGYLATDTLKDAPLIHFGFVRGPLRGQGVMRQILKASGVNPNEAILAHYNPKEEWIKAKWPGVELLDFFK